MSELLDGWKIVTIAEVTDYISRGKSPKYTDLSSLPVVNQKAIRWFGIQKEHLKYVHSDQFESWAPERYIQEGDILWNSTGTGTIGRACLVCKENLEPPKVVDSHVTIVRPNRASIESSYLFAWIRSSEVQDTIASLYSGSTNQVELNRATIAATQIPLAPLNEQKRIADKLDALLARVDTCRERLDRVPLILKRFRQAVLATATSGQLTEDWRENNNYLDWESQTLQDVANIVDPHPSHRTPKESPEGVPYIGIGDLDASGSFDFLNARKVSRAVLKEHQERYTLREGDFIFGKIGTLGKATSLPIKTEYTLSANVILIQPNATLVEPRFLMFFLQAPITMDEIEKQSNSTSQAAFGIKKMRLFEFLMPGLREQQEIVRRVETLFALADRLEARYKTARIPVEQLTPALLAKAFRGELVPQDPNDEPASVLLERIRAARVVAEEDGTKSRRRKADKSSKAEVIVSKRKEVQPSQRPDVLKTRDPLTAEALFSASQLELNIDDSAV